MITLFSFVFQKLIILSTIFFQEMDDEILYSHAHLYNAMETFVEKKLNKLKHITLRELINDLIYRRLLIKYIECVNPSSDSMNVLKRFLLCQKILEKHEFFDLKTCNKLIELSPSFQWEQKLNILWQKRECDLNFIHQMETLKWETILELICHNDYKCFLSAIKRKSTMIIRILKEIYEYYYF